MASGSIEANGYRAVIDVLTAVITSPAVDTDAGVSTNCVEAGTPIVAGVGLHETLVDVLSTVLSWRGYIIHNINSCTLGLI